MNTVLVENLISTLTHSAAIKGAWLSGSRGRGDADAYSDIDVLVLVADGQEETTFLHFKDKINEISPVVFFKTIVSSRTINAITPGWERFDLTFVNLAQLKRETKSSVKPLYDPEDITRQLAESSATLTKAEPAMVTDLVNEFLRVLGLMAVVINRKEFVVAQTGSTLLRDMLIRLMGMENAPQVFRGAMSLRKSLTAEQISLLESIPPLSAQQEPVMAANKMIAQIFLSRARLLAVKINALWPEEFEKLTLTHLRKNINFSIE